MKLYFFLIHGPFYHLITYTLSTGLRNKLETKSKLNEQDFASRYFIYVTSVTDISFIISNLKQ